MKLQGELLLVGCSKCLGQGEIALSQTEPEAQHSYFKPCTCKDGYQSYTVPPELLSVAGYWTTVLEQEKDNTNGNRYNHATNILKELLTQLKQ